jgi:hypothetical protein
MALLHRAFSATASAGEYRLSSVDRKDCAALSHVHTSCAISLVSVHTSAEAQIIKCIVFRSQDLVENESVKYRDLRFPGLEESGSRISGSQTLYFL